MKKTVISAFWDLLKNKKQILRIAAIIILLFLTYILDMMPFTYPQGISPDLLIVFAVCVAIFEAPLNAAIIGAIAGLLKDISSSGLFGFHGVVYLCLCVAVSLCIAFLVRRTFLNAVIINLIAVFTDKIFYFFIYNVLFDRGGGFVIFYRSLLPSFLLSIVAVPAFYFIIKKISIHLE